MAKVRYAIIGFGGIAENRVAKEGYACDKKRFRPLKKAVLTGATDVNPARQAAAEALGLKWYPNAEAVFADPAIDAVYIATNNASHAKLALAALKAYLVDIPDERRLHRGGTGGASNEQQKYKQKLSHNRYLPRNIYQCNLRPPYG